MRRLIVNADDFGQTEGINAGIVEAHRHGILTSATLMANGASFEHAVALSHDHPRLGVGVHLNLVEGSPVSSPKKVPSLLKRGSVFSSKSGLLVRHMTGRLCPDHMRREIGAQIRRVLDAGIVPTHLDSHQHIHAYPPFFRIVTEMAVRHGIGAVRVPRERVRLCEAIGRPAGTLRTALLNLSCRASRRHLDRVRLRTTEQFAGTLRTGAVTSEWLAGWLRDLPDGSCELMVHPGRCDANLVRMKTRLKAQRETELRTLVSKSVLQSVDSSAVELIHYGNLIEDQEAPQARDGGRERAATAAEPVGPSDPSDGAQSGVMSGTCCIDPEKDISL